VRGKKAGPALISTQSHLGPACALVALALLSACERPTRNQSTLKAIEAEAHMLMEQPVDIAKAELERRKPPAIASLKPDFVSIDADGVYITTKAYFDGGWGYFVPRDRRTQPQPSGRFTKLGAGIYWYAPY
jgi:hypothetical protein